MPIKRIPLCLNIDDPEQKELYEFVTALSNGKKRNSSAFLRLLVDREYQVKKRTYLAEKARLENEKEVQFAPQVDVIKSYNGQIRYLPSDYID